jgi:hypothetical protein
MNTAFQSPLFPLFCRLYFLLVLIPFFPLPIALPQIHMIDRLSDSLCVAAEKHEAAAADDQEQGVRLHQQEEEEGVRHLPRGRDQDPI